MITNPKDMALNMLQQRAQGNPMFSNLLQLARSGDSRSIEQIVRNMAKERGVDYDKEFNSFKQMFGFK